jgi:hypothetical protein
MRIQVANQKMNKEDHQKNNEFIYEKNRRETKNWLPLDSHWNHWQGRRLHHRPKG